MTDKNSHKDRLQENMHLQGLLSSKETEAEENSCAAFGYLRGIRDRANAIEFRFLNANTFSFPYSWLGPCRYDPSEGLLLKFSGDLVYIALIRGSNLDLSLNDGQMNLAAGLHRHRVTWIRVMPEQDIKAVGETGPTVDSIQIIEFDSNADLKEWLAKHAPAFAK